MPPSSSATRSACAVRSPAGTGAGASSASRPPTSCRTTTLIQPGHGIYVARASFAGETHCAAVNVGVRPTFKTDLVVLVEAYILDWSGDLYGVPLTLDFVARLRGERRFASAEALVEQMHRDVADARAVCDAGSATVPRR